MAHTPIPIAACFTLLCLGQLAYAQTTGGSATIDIDQVSGVATATCETDLDAIAENYYQAEVHCAVVDGYGTQIAYGEQTDDHAKGFAQVVLIFKSIPGTVYSVTANHFMVITLDQFSLPADGEPQESVPYDLFNFRFYELNPGDYLGSFLLGPGPPPPR